MWVPLLLLFAGMGLLDRSFAWWRNDGRNFPGADGVYYPLPPGTPPPGWWSNHVLLKAMACSGLGMLLASVVLFGPERE